MQVKEKTPRKMKNRLKLINYFFICFLKKKFLKNNFKMYKFPFFNYI